MDMNFKCQLRHANHSHKEIEINMFRSVLVTLTVILLFTGAYSAPTEKKAPRNLIMMVTDGMGPQQLTFARHFAQMLNPNVTDLPQEKYLIGTQETISFDSLVTDSAAGATAFSCGLRTNNGMVAVTPVEEKPCGTIFEAASLKGYKTGTVSTSRVTHATPAAFTSHVKHRDDEDLIADQQINSKFFDLFLGGGRREFIPQSEKGSKRKDDRDIIEEAKKQGWKYVETTAELENHNEDEFPLLGLFAKSHMNYEIDRNATEQPSLAQMSKKALSILKKASDKDGSPGFMILIEGSRIDMAAHGNEAWTMAREILAFQEAFEVVEEFVQENPDTLVLATSDHDTGGLSLGWQLDPEVYPEYRWDPSCLRNISISSELIVKNVIWPFKKEWENRNGTEVELVSFLSKTMNAYLGVTSEEPNWLDSVVNLVKYTKKLTSGDSYPIQGSLSALIQRSKCGIGYTTHGHTGADVNTYGIGIDAEHIRGHVNNYDVGKVLFDIFDLDAEEATKQVQNAITENLHN